MRFVFKFLLFKEKFLFFFYNNNILEKIDVRFFGNFLEKRLSFQF